MPRRTTRPALFTSAAMIVASLFLSVSAVAQERRREGGGPGYDSASERTVRATASHVFALPVGPEQHMSVLTVTTEGRTLHVVLAPPDFVEKRGFAVKSGEAVEVIGVAGLQVNGEPAMLARQVKVGGKTFTLRDATGRPAWGG